MAKRRTLAAEAFAQGVSLHAGAPVGMRLLPAASPAGICFRRTDLEGSASIPALWQNVADIRLGTVLKGADGASVGVVEHVLAALSGAGIDDCLMEVAGPEPPILDGDALSYLHLIEKAGVRENAAVREFIRVRKEVSFNSGGGSVRLLPCEGPPQFAFEIDFESAAIGHQSFLFSFTPENFRREIAPAHTFGFKHQAEQLRASGFGLGANLANTLVIDGDRLMNPELRRFPDEFVRHKILDAIGDLALAGAPIIARFEGRRSSHAMNNALLRSLFSDAGNYERTVE